MKNSATVLLSRRPAHDWNAAYPMGNGKLGAMVFGGVQSERIDLNHDELWTGYPGRDPYDGANYEALERAKEQVRRGDLRGAEETIAAGFTGASAEAYMPLGTLTIGFGLPDGEATDYRRELDLENARQTVSFRIGDVVFCREYIVSYPVGAFFVRLSASVPGALSFSASLSSPLLSFSVRQNGILTLDGQCPINSQQNRERVAGRDEWYVDDPARSGIRFRGALTVLDTDGVPSKETDGQKEIAVSGASYALLGFTAATSFAGYDRHPVTEGKEYRRAALAALDSLRGITWDEQVKEHERDWHTFWDRTSFSLGGEENPPETDRRLVAHSDGEADPSLYALYFNFGKYLLLSSSRPGSQATNLQGIWSNLISPPWNSDYTVNINTEMNDWATLPLNLPEMQEPLIDLIRGIADRGRQTARTLYRADGFVCHHNTDLWRHTAPVSGKPVWSFWTGSGGWLCRHLYDRYLYTGDAAFLRDVALPIMREAARFYLSQLEEDGEGYLIYLPGTSPESRFIVHGTGENCVIGKTSTMMMAIIRELFSSILSGEEILGERSDLSEPIAAALPRLLPYRTEDASGCLREWYEDAEAEDPKHRHISALYGLHPARQITPDGTPELAEAARKLMARRGDEGTGWSLAWKINFAARLFEGDHALRLLDLQLRPAWTVGERKPGEALFKGGTYPNLFDAHPPFQIDGNFGAVAGMIEMIVQSREGEVLLLPALPGSWGNGEIRGIRLIGNLILDLVWRDGKPIKWKIKGNTDGVKITWRGQVLPPASEE